MRVTHGPQTENVASLPRFTITNKLIKSGVPCGNITGLQRGCKLGKLKLLWLLACALECLAWLVCQGYGIANQHTYGALFPTYLLIQSTIFEYKIFYSFCFYLYFFFHFTFLHFIKKVYCMPLWKAHQWKMYITVGWKYENYFIKVKWNFPKPSISSKHWFDSQYSM